MISKHGGHIFEKFNRCANVCGILFLHCAFRMLIGWQEISDHIEGSSWKVKHRCLNIEHGC